MAGTFFCDERTIVETKQGKLKGFNKNGIYIFRGIPYAKARRFHKPEPVKPWDGVREALAYGYVCPLMDQPGPDLEIMVPHRYWMMSEDCLNLNVWTKRPDPAAKKPVMVWFHGGGFYAGSAIEHIAYDGAALCDFGDVVVVSVNHRLNILGYLDLSEYGSEYAGSGNAGNMDLVSSLLWVKENISAFGGDPDNVTVFGQSGGGEKIVTLMNTPAAEGLFHKAIIQSGVFDMHQEEGSAKPLVEEMLRILGEGPDENMENIQDEPQKDSAGGSEQNPVWGNSLRKESGTADVKQLEELPYTVLSAVYKQAVRKVADQGSYIGCWPKADDWYLGDPRTTGQLEWAKKIPVLIGTVLGEFTFETKVRDKYHMDPAVIKGLVEEKYGSYADEVADAFAVAYPDKSPADALYADAVVRRPTKAYARMRAQDGGRVWTYLLTYDFPLNGGQIPWHCAEIPFVFHNTDLVEAYNVPGETEKLEEIMAGCWVHFAYAGEPGMDSFPEWQMMEPEREYCMLFDKTCRVAIGHDDRLIQSLTRSGQARDHSVKDMVAPEENKGKMAH